MEFFDSHAHYNDEKFAADWEEVQKKIREAGVSRIINAGYNLASSKIAVEMANQKEGMYAICGVSPNDIGENYQAELWQIEEIAKTEAKVKAIGEIGLDYHWNEDNKELQKKIFIEQIKIANRQDKPIVIHSRDAYKDTIHVLKQWEVRKRGIFHCCQLNCELVKEALALGYYISLAGACTFKNAKHADEVIKLIPDERLLIETDSPYLAPEPKRGTRNDSSNLIWIAKKIAEVKQVDVEKIAEITYKNASNIFGI